MSGADVDANEYNQGMRALECLPRYWRISAIGEEYVNRNDTRVMVKL